MLLHVTQCSGGDGQRCMTALRDTSKKKKKKAAEETSRVLAAWRCLDEPADNSYRILRDQYFVFFL